MKFEAPSEKVDAVDFVHAGQLDHQFGILGGERFALAALAPLVAMRQVEKICRD